MAPGQERSLQACVSLANWLAGALDPRYPPPNRTALPAGGLPVDANALLEEAAAYLQSA